MKIAELCKMIEDSVRSGRYPLDSEMQGQMADSVQVINRSESDDLDASSVIVETRVRELYVVNSYVPNIQHLPGIIELDAIDSFKMICRRIERLDSGIKLRKQ